MKKIDYSPKVQRSTIKRFGRGPTPSGIKPWTPIDTSANARNTPKLRSRVTPGGTTALKPVLQYTGEKMLGVSQMAKSNAVPVFDTAHITDIARMRR